MLSYLVLGFTIFNSSHLSTLICSDLSWGFLGIPYSAGVFGEAVMSPKALRIQCSSKLVKIPMKCMLDNLKVIVVLRLEINLTSCFNTKSSLIWSFKLSRTVTKLFKQYDWVIWLISTNILSCKFWYIMVPVMEKLSLGEFTCVSILLANQIHTFECWYLCIVKKSFWHYNWLIFSNSFWYATENMIQKSYTKVNFIRSQLDLNVLYNMLQLTYKWKLNLKIF